MAKKYVEAKSYSKWGTITRHDGRVRSAPLFCRIEKENYIHTNPADKTWVVVTRGKVDGPIVFCMTLREWSEFSGLFDDIAAEVAFEALEQIGE